MTNPTQRLSSKEEAILHSGQALLKVFLTAGREEHARYRRARRIYALDDDGLDAGQKLAPGEKTPQLPHLVSSVRNAVADMCDNLPKLIYYPETEAQQTLARDLTDVAGYILEARDFPSIYRQVCEDKFVTGTGVYQVFWNEDCEGQGGVDILRWPIENLWLDPASEDPMEGRAIFKVSRHPMSYFRERWPKLLPYITREEPLLTDGMDIAGDEPGMHLIEYWYRRYQNGSWQIHSALMAGGALLDASELRAPQGVYRHGQYPFVMDHYRRVNGRSLGMIDDLYPLQEAADRYARYEDRNARLSSRQRFLVNEASGLNAADVADCEKDILTARTISEAAVRPLTVAPLNPQIALSRATYLSMIKEESGQNLFNRGEVGGGVTAASAILALQEAGNKITRNNLAITTRAVTQLGRQVLWLICQFFQPRRAFYLTGRENGLTGWLTEARVVALSGMELMDGKAYPPYLARVELQKNQPLRVQARNELILQAAQLAQQSGAPLPASVIFSLLNLDGDNDRLVKALEDAEARAGARARENDTLAQARKALGQA